MKRYLIFLVYFFVFIGVNTNAQDVSFRAVGPSAIGIGEQFRITYTVSTQKASNFVAPPMTGFEVLSGPSQSRSSSTSNINGVVSQTSSISITYVLQATKEGVFNIPKAKINAEGKVFTSNSLTIKVSKNPIQSQRAQYQGGKQNQIQQKQTTVTVLDNHSLFIKASSNRSVAVCGQEVIITYKLYTLVPISEYQVNKMPINKGFWVEELDMSKDPLISEEVVDGKRYQVATLRKVIAYPQQSGRLEIAPLDIDIVAMMLLRNQRKMSTGDPFFDSFFNDPFFQSMQSSYERVKKNLKSNSIIINVSPLPKTNLEFSGAVGDFKITASASSLKCKTNEVISLKYTISGSGNLSLIDKVNLKLPNEFETYDPKIEDKLNRTQTGVSGSRTFEYLIIPRIQGEYKIPSVDFSYYDINSKQYKTISTQEFIFDIEKGKSEMSSAAKQISLREKYRNRDIGYISTDKFEPISFGDFTFNKSYFYLLILLFPILTLIFIYYRNKILTINKDVTYIKYKKASKTAIKRMKKAHNYLVNNQSDEFYTEVAQAIWDYLSDRFKFKKIELSIENIEDKFSKINIETSTIKELISLLNDCEYVRFSPSENKTKMDLLYNNAVKIISDLETYIK